MTNTPTQIEKTATAVGNFVGLPPLAPDDLAPIAVAVVLIGGIYLLARLLAQPLQRWLKRISERLLPSERLNTIDASCLGRGAADLIAFLILGAATAVVAWPPYPNLLLALALAATLSLAVFRIVRGGQQPTAIAAALAVIVGSMTLSNRYDQLDRIEQSLDSFAVSMGGLRLSLLTVLTLLLGGVVLYTVARVVVHGARAFIRSRPNLDATQQLLAEKITAIVVGVVAIFAAFQMVGFDTTSLSIFSGTIGLGLGFGLQKIFSNLISGIILLMDRSIKPGDTIVVGNTGIAGEVRKIGVRAASVVTRDGKVHLIPNELLMTERVENWAYAQAMVRMRLAVAVAYDSDLALVRRLMVDAAKDTDRVQGDPAPVVRITDLSDRGVVHELRYWITRPDMGIGNIRDQIYLRILDSFAANGVRMPNPMREIELLPPQFEAEEEEKADDEI